MLTFNEYIKKIRMEKRITLREFCRTAGFDPSNWSKIERGILAPPKSKRVIGEIAKALQIKEKSEEYLTLVDLAAIAQVPSELINNKQIVENLPVFFRTLRGQKPTREELNHLLKFIKED